MAGVAKFKQLALLDFAVDTLPASTVNELKSLCDELIFVSSSDQSFPTSLGIIDGLLVRLGATVDSDLINAASQLRYIGMLGTGYGRIDIACAADRSIVVTNIADYSTNAVAEFIFGALLENKRELSRAKAQAGTTDYSEVGFAGTEIASTHFAVIGLGDIGTRVADIASNGFNARVSYWSRSSRATNSELKFLELDELLATADVVSLNLASNDDTNGFLSERRIGLLQRGAVVINTAPMELIDTGALEMRLTSGDLTFIFDHADEMDAADARRLASYETCTAYPPIGYTTVEASEAKLRIFVENIRSYLLGNPTNQVN